MIIRIILEVLFKDTAQMCFNYEVPNIWPVILYKCPVYNDTNALEV